MLPVVFPNSYGHQPLPEIFHGLHHYLSTVDEDIEPESSIKILPCKKPISISSNSLYGSVPPNPNYESFQGSYKRHRSKTGTILLKDLSRICQLSLETSFFTQMGRIFKQTRGSAIGNQISPSLANIAVSYKEQQWFNMHRQALEA